MKAAQISQYGHAEVVKIVDIDIPVVGDDQALVRVHASSINPFDTTVREGYVKALIKTLPVTLGGDIAGEITQLGSGVMNFSIGDKVYGQANAVAGNSGAFAEYATTAASQIAKAPVGLDFELIAALPLVGVSAIQAITQHINLQPDQSILIHGGAGGIGTMAIQIAKHIGAHVVTTATGDGIDYVRGLGADEIIDYRTQDFTTLVRDLDAVFDTVGGDTLNDSLPLLKKGGVAVSMIAQADETKVDELGVTAITQATKVTTEALSELAQLVEAGVITPHVEKVFPLADIRQAFEARESGAIRGKVVIKI